MLLVYLIHRAKSWFWTMFYRFVARGAFTELGQGVTFEGWVHIPQRNGRIAIGRGVRFCSFVELSVPAGGELIIGDGAFIGRGSILSAHRCIKIGQDTLIAENVSIHDNNHQTADTHVRIQEQGFIAEPIEVGRDCWIGARAVLVCGSGMGDRCILGAGAVLTRKVEQGVVCAGVPAKPIRQPLASWPQAA